MAKRDGLARALAIIGVVLLLVPILLPVVFSLRFIGRPGGYMIDYLMPFEVYPVAVVGFILVLLASLRARLRRGAVGISIGVMLGGVVLGAVAAQLTGIANSVETLEAWRYAVVIGFGAISLIGQLTLAVIGILLVRDLSEAKQAEPAAAAAGTPEESSES